MRQKKQMATWVVKLIIFLGLLAGGVLSWAIIHYQFRNFDNQQVVLNPHVQVEPVASEMYKVICPAKECDPHEYYKLTWRLVNEHKSWNIISTRNVEPWWGHQPSDVSGGSGWDFTIWARSNVH